MINPIRIYTFIKSFTKLKALIIEDSELESLDDAKLPVYTLLIPLKSEKEMAPKLVDNIDQLDYPKDKLDVKFLVETNDKETIDALKSKGIALSTADAHRSDIGRELLLIPPGLISTKPRKCDYGLAFARGKYTVIYDAEDKPDPKQLKKAVIGFSKVKLNTVCLQCKLNFYNSRQNVLTRFFSLEYGFWYEYYLPGLQEISSPIPLGGTSNHFVTSYLNSVGTWDPYNVTEDADLGLRIFRYKYETAMLNSYTLEEANSQVGSWIRQRTRWQKGFLLTFLVHTSHPIYMLKQLGLTRFLLSMITFGGNFFLPFYNPIMWLIFLFSFFPGLSIFHITEPNRLYAYIAVFNLTVGNLTYIILHAFSAYKNKRYDLIPLSLLMPLYWILISIATIRAGIQFIQNPFYWEKTKHGLQSK